MRCPHCHNRLLQKSGTQTLVRVQGKLTIDGNGVCSGQCYWCKSVVQLPLRLAEGTQVEAERFILNK